MVIFFPLTHSYYLRSVIRYGRRVTAIVLLFKYKGAAKIGKEQSLFFLFFF
ncbi:hypothetical protein BDV26DRAFT_259199, partial [Aspergillus bertholletiae]